MKLVIDACVFAAEQIHDQTEHQTEHQTARTLLQTLVQRKVQFYAPALVLAEVAAAVARATQQSSLGEVGALRVSHLPRLTFRHIDLPFASAAARVAARHGIQGADSHYVALARELRCPLITNDEEILRRCPSTTVVLRPATWLQHLA
ncbi:PIN domain-containing protein [Prosthecobacter sp.]|uniref:PIN domain-containing protein n=1 Tax=Prosthecobacter sp. TaxID=1965333 RepID=UPI0037834BF9